MKPIIGLSTCWCSPRHTDGYAMLQEVASYGFAYVELSHGIRITLVPGILRALEEGVVQVCSTHNFCPLPTGVNQAAPNIFMPSVRDPRQQDQWLRHTRRSLDFAHQVKARALVTHLGTVEFLWLNPVRKLRKFMAKHPDAVVPGDPRYQAVLAGAMGKLRKRMPSYWEQTQKSVNAILPYAAEKQVRLGLENREKFEELPVDGDFPEFLKGLSHPGSAGYWHDTGHANIKEHMGLINHRQQLADNADQLVGFHLHDVDAKNQDHQEVGTGRIDFKMVSEFWRPHHLLVIELSPRLKPEQMLASKARIEELVAERFGA